MVGRAMAAAGRERGAWRRRRPSDSRRAHGIRGTVGGLSEEEGGGEAAAAAGRRKSH